MDVPMQTYRIQPPGLELGGGPGTRNISQHKLAARGKGRGSPSSPRCSVVLKPYVSPSRYLMNSLFRMLCCNQSLPSPGSAQSWCFGLR